MTTDICFQGVPVWATAVNNQTHLASIWCGNSGPPSGQYSTVDLDFTKALGTISDKSAAQYDDFLTTITSSTTPVAGGAVYYAINYASSPSFSSVLATGSYTIPSGNYDYQYKLWAIVNGSTITRYHGFKVKVTEVINTDTVTIDIYRVSDTTPQATNLQVQLTSTSTCLPASYDASTVTAVKDTVGALYLSSSFITTNSLEVPKLPPSLGSTSWPSSPKRH
jgi:hypothetical protein